MSQPEGLSARMYILAAVLSTIAIIASQLMRAMTIAYVTGAVAVIALMIAVGIDMSRER